MDDRASATTAFDTLAETVGEETAESLELLGNQTRMEIIVALWDAIEKVGARVDSDDGLSFSELYDCVSVSDSGQFSYHLDKLTGKFVEHDDGIYTLNQAGQRFVITMIPAGLTESPSFADEPVATDCPYCGESVVIDYNEGFIAVRCTQCEGGFRGPDDPPGLISRLFRQPGGFENQTPQEFWHRGRVRNRHNLLTRVEGVCPECTWTVTATADICEDHDPGDESLCPHCRRQDEIRWSFVCENCKIEFHHPGWFPIFTEAAVVSFCYERGLDLYEAWDRGALQEYQDPLETSLTRRDPIEITVTVNLEGDRLQVTLDEDAQVIDIEETIGVA